MSVSSYQSLASRNTRRATEESLILLEEERRINTARNAFVNKIPESARLSTTDGSRRSSRISKVRQDAETNSQPSTPLIPKIPKWPKWNTPKPNNSQVQAGGQRQTLKFEKTPRPPQSAHVPAFEDGTEEDEDDDHSMNDEHYQKLYLKALRAGNTSKKQTNETPVYQHVDDKQYGRKKSTTIYEGKHASKSDNKKIFAVEGRARGDTVFGSDEDSHFELSPEVRIDGKQSYRSELLASRGVMSLQQSQMDNEYPSYLPADIPEMMSETQKRWTSEHETKYPEQEVPSQPGNQPSTSIRAEQEAPSNERWNYQAKNITPKQARLSPRFALEERDERSYTPGRYLGPCTPTASKTPLIRRSRYISISDRTDSINSNIPVVNAGGTPPRRSPTPVPEARYTKADAFCAFYVIFILGILLSNLALSFYWGHYFAETGPPAPCDMTVSTKPFPLSWSDRFKIFRRPDVSWDPVVRKQMEEFGQIIGADPWLMENCILPKNVMKLPLVTCQDRLPWYNLTRPQTLWLNERSGWGYSIDYDITEEFNVAFDMAFEFQELQTSWLLSDLGPSSGTQYENRRCNACAEKPDVMDMSIRKKPDWFMLDYLVRPSISRQESVRKRLNNWIVSGDWFGVFRDRMVHKAKLLKSVTEDLPYWQRGHDVVYVDGRNGRWTSAASRYTDTSDGPG